jgi:hypothetical protein
MLPEALGAKVTKKKSSVFESINFSKRVDIERSEPPKKYGDDKDSEIFHNPLCLYRGQNIRAMTQKFDEEITGQILRYEV